MARAERRGAIVQDRNGATHRVMVVRAGLPGERHEWRVDLPGSPVHEWLYDGAELVTGSHYDQDDERGEVVAP